MEEKRRNATICQWNARSLESCISVFRQFIFKYRFWCTHSCVWISGTPQHSFVRLWTSPFRPWCWTKQNLNGNAEGCYVCTAWFWTRHDKWIRCRTRSNLRDLESAQVQVLRAYLELPKCASNVGTSYDARTLSPAVVRAQETLWVHLRHIAQHEHHTLAAVGDTRPDSGYSKFIAQLHNYLQVLLEIGGVPKSLP